MVLNSVRSRYTSGQIVPAAVQHAANELNLDQLGIERFSQLVTDAFAGATWFRLLRYLDSGTPNPVHNALAELAASSTLRVVVTTNFDTLLERAFSEVVDTQVVHALQDAPDSIDPTLPVILKLHGSAARPTTLDDLATQKNRGLSEEWGSYLAQLWTDHAVLVLGFSGTDASFGGDYLRLKKASRETPWLRWNIRNVGQASPQAAEIVKLCGARGDYLVGDLPDALEQYAINVPAARPAQRRLRPLERHVAAWLDRNSGDAGACGVVVARMLGETGQDEAEGAAFDALRFEARKQLAAGVPPAAAARMALVLAQVAHDTADRHPRRAITDLDLALRAYQAVIDYLGVPEDWPPHAREERASAMCALLQSRARAHLNLKQHRAADKWNAAAREFFEEMTPLARQSHRAVAAEIAGAAAYYRRDWNGAREQLQLAHDLALASGRPDHAAVIEQNLAGLPHA